MRGDFVSGQLLASEEGLRSTEFVITLVYTHARTHTGSFRGTRGGAVGWGRDVACSITDGDIVNFSFRPHCGPGVDSASNRNECHEYSVQGVKTAGAYGWPHHLNVPTVMKSGRLKILEPSGPVQACTEIALPLSLPLQWLYAAVHPNSDISYQHTPCTKPVPTPVFNTLQCRQPVHEKIRPVYFPAGSLCERRSATAIRLLRCRGGRGGGILSHF